MIQRTPPVELLPWDSQFFGFNVARITETCITPGAWTQVLSWCQMNGIRCLYYEADLSDFQSQSTASLAGFVAVDVRVVFECLITGDFLRRNVSDLKDSRFVIRSVQPNDLPAVERVAREMGKVSRFALDPQFPRGASGKMYTIWMRKINQSMDGIVLIGVLNNQIAGFVACEKQKQVGRIALVGVHSAFQRRGTGYSLLSAALHWFSKQDCTVVRVSTQGRNLASQRLYQKSGFHTASVSLIYHRWFDLE